VLLAASSSAVSCNFFSCSIHQLVLNHHLLLICCAINYHLLHIILYLQHLMLTNNELLTTLGRGNALSPSWSVSFAIIWYKFFDLCPSFQVFNVVYNILILIKIFHALKCSKITVYEDQTTIQISFWQLLIDYKVFYNPQLLKVISYFKPRSLICVKILYYMDFTIHVLFLPPFYLKNTTTVYFNKHLEACHITSIHISQTILSQKQK